MMAWAAKRPCANPDCPELVSRRNQKYCSRQCFGAMAAESRRGSTHRWRKVRRRALMRDHHLCVRCKSMATEVDHIVPVSQGGGDELSNLRSVCTLCHLARHRGEWS